MRGRRLFRFFSDVKWAEAFLEEGSMLFHSLAYFRDYEDGEIRGDRNEGTVIMRPPAGLQGYNRTQRRPFFMPDAAFESPANAGEIFVYCTSKSDNEEKRRRFRAVACIEILDAKAFCRRVQRELPNCSRFGGRPGHKRIGQHVEYYEVTEVGNRRWALPDVIASSKLDSYRWQDEFRLVFSFTDALDFEKVQPRIVRGASKRAPNPAEHHSHPLKIGSVGDIAILHKVAISLTASFHSHNSAG